MPGPARAQTPNITKTLCQGTNCGLATVAPGAAVYYLLTLTNTSSMSVPVTIVDTLPAGFVPVSYGCAAVAGAATATIPSTAQTLVISTNVPGTGPGSGQWQCVIAGTFAAGAVSGANNVAQIVDPANHATVLGTATHNNNVDLAAPLPSNLSITKTANLTSVDISSAAQTVTYTITIANNGLEDVYLGQLLTLEDTLSLPPLGVVLNATYVSASCALVPVGGGSDCLNAAPVFTPPMPVLVGSGVPVPFARWRYPPSGLGSNGLLKAGHQMVLTVVVRLSRVPGVTCILAANADGVDNHAHIVLTLPAAVPGGPITTISDGNANDNHADVLVHVDTGATLIDPACNAPYQPPSPVLQVTKIQLLPPPGTAPHPWPTTATYIVTVRNISTTPNLRIRNIRVQDWVVQGLETPSFTAQRMSYSCTAPCTPATPLAPQQFLGNFATHQMAGGGTLVAQSGGGLAYNQTASFIIAIRYMNPGCDSYPAMNPKPIFNLGRVIGWEEDVGGTVTQVNQIVQGAVVTRMRPVPPCPLTVQKTSTSTGVVLFNNSPNTNATTLYTIVYGNPTNQSFTMGTLIDAMRIVPNPTGVAPYAVQLQVDYAYNCMPIQGTVTGYPAANPNAGNTTTPYDTAQVVVTQLPQQGVRLIRNLQPVIFGPNSKLQCSLFAWVHRPAANDPYCSTGQLENAAILDASIFYDPNSSWTGTPGMWSSVIRPLPRCHNLVVNKDATPPWIWPGGPVTWTLHVTNAGPVIVPGDRLIVTDTISGGGTATSSTTTCIVSTSCSPAPNWTPSPTAGNPSVLNIGGLALNSEIRTTMSATASAGPGGQACNAATASVSQFVLPPYTLYYWKNPQTLSANACVPVLAAGALTVAKTLTNTVGAQLPANFAFPINVNCATFGPNGTVGVGAGGTWIATHVPAGSTCTISEGNLPVLAPTATCANPVWSTTYSPGATVVIPQANNSSTTVTVANAITCAPRGTLVIRKITVAGPAPPNFTTAQFNVNCSPGGPATVVAVAANGQATVGNIPAPATCTIAEQPLPPQAGCSWVATQVPPGGVAITAGATTTVTVTNRLVCPTAPGRLVINKQTIFPPGVPQNLNVSFNLNCNPGGQRGVSGPVNGQLIDANIPAPATCTVVEMPMTAPPGCTWTPTQTPPGSVAIVPGGTTTVNVTNRLVCNGPGTLEIRKLTNFPAGVPQFASVQVNVSCTPGGTNTTVTVPANGNVVIPNIAAPSTCTVTEQPPPAPPGCTWTAGIFSPGAPSSGGIPINTGVTAVALLVNNLVCPAAPGRILIRKTTIVPPGMPVPASVPFNVSCAFGTLTMTVSVPANGQNTSGSIPAGNSCSVTEQLPPAPPGCSWTATRVPAGNIVVATGATVTVNATNRLDCPGAVSDATLLVRKFVLVNGSSTPTSPMNLPAAWGPVTFPVNITCPPNPPLPVTLGPANNYQTTPAELIGATCTVQENTPTFPFPNCHWVTTYPQGPSAIIQPGTTTIDVYNEQVCN